MQTKCHPDCLVLHTKAKGRKKLAGLAVRLAIPFLKRLADWLVLCGQAPAGVYIGEVDVGDLINNGLKTIVIFLETR